jgi:hypothetical protein
MTKRTCLRCGSDQIIPNVPISDKHGEWGNASDPLEVQIHGNPAAWLFKDTAAGRLVAFICGACGHTELKAQGFLKLYRKYQESLRQEAEQAPGKHPEAELREGAPGDLVVCLSCGESIPENASRCPRCEWTWEETREE